ncbi:MAG TPA: hypothetical protein VF432_29820 [Thermoanaerobaculia bacterium]
MLRALVALVLCAVPALARTEAPVAPLAFGPAAPFFSPAVAGDGLQSFAVWNDGRDRAMNAIYGARLGAGGELLDPVGVRLLDEGLGQPAVAYGDGRYLAIDASTRFAIVDREANVVARGVVAEGAFGAVRVVFNGRDFVVLWGYDGVNVSVVDREGRVSEPATLVAPQYDTRLQAAATNGSRIVALYTRGAELRAAVASATGAPASDSAIAQMIFAEVQASVTASDGGFLAVWQLLAGPDVAAARLDANGALVQGPAVVVSGAGAPAIVGNRLFTLEGEIHHSRLVVRRLAGDLTVGPPDTLIDPPALSAGAYAASAAVVVAHLHDPNRRVPEQGLYAVDADVGGQLRLVSRAGLTQLEPRVAAGERGTLVVWREEAGLAAAFLPRAGEAEHFAVATGPTRSHAVAAQGGTHLVVWATNDGMFARLYRGNEVRDVALDASGFSDVAAASDGRGFLAAWAQGGEIHIARITTDGDVTGRTAVRYGSVTHPPSPALACDGGECIVAWRNQTSTWTCPRFGCLVVDERVLAMRFDASLALIDPEPLVLSGKHHGITGVTAAAGGGGYAVGWASLAQTYVHTLGDGERLIGPGAHPVLARDDRGWLLVREAGGELVAVRLRDAGAPYEFTLFRDAQARTAPALARDGGVTVAAYERTTRGEAAGGVPRIFVTAVGPAESKRRAISR